MRMRKKASAILMRILLISGRGVVIRHGECSPTLRRSRPRGTPLGSRREESRSPASSIT